MSIYPAWPWPPFARRRLRDRRIVVHAPVVATFDAIDEGSSSTAYSDSFDEGDSTTSYANAIDEGASI